uniref:monocarboxylate transporter 5-like isoform X2 n=1 Tax=Pristiophorus japonicus TaxID=55135 RepID=UPI00398E59CF
MSGPSGAQHRTVANPPEGGWGWIIVFNFFVINLLAMGILKSFGILSVALQETFQTSMEQISWIGSIMSCVRLTAGCGFAFLSQAAALNTTKYFRRRLTTAYAISRSGTGLTFALAPFLQYLLNEYGWQGAILILCGLTLHLIPLGMLNRPLYLKQDSAVDSEHQKKLQPLEGKKDAIAGGVSRAPPPVSHHHEPVKGSSLSTQNGLEESNSVPRIEKLAPAQNHRAAEGSAVLQPKEFPLSQEPILLSQLPSTTLPGCKVQNGNSNQILTTVAMPTDTRHKGFCRELGAQLKSVSVGVRHLIDFTLLTNPLFIIFTTCTFFSQLAYFIPYFHLVAKAKALGIEPFQATLLISVAGIVEIVAQLISGYVADRNWTKKYQYHKVYLLFCGAVNLLSPPAQTFSTLMVYIVFFAIFCGGYLTLLLPVLVDFIGIDRIQKGIGLFQFFVGIGCLIGPPAAGILYDFTKNYDASFQLAGACYLLSCLVLFLVPLAERKLSQGAEKSVMEDSNNLAQGNVLPPSPECSSMKKECLELESMV